MTAPITPVSFAPRTTAPGMLAATAASRLATRDFGETNAEAFALALELGADSPVPGSGSTRDLWEALATVAATDLGIARVVEPHLDALSILAEAGRTGLATGGAGAGCVWGVFAAEGGPDPLLASADDDAWFLSGTKPWCSLAGQVGAALITAATASGDRRMFAVDLSQDGISVSADAWVARGLVEIPSGPVHFDAVPVVAVGEPGWYLSRPGFSWGGIGVAACWFGGAVGIARTVFDAVAARPDAGPLLHMHLGAIDEALESARLALFDATARIDSGTLDASEGRLLAKRVRATVARTVEDVIVRAGHALGPAPLALDAVHAKRVADLTLYVRQHHAEKDLASLGEAISREERAPW